MSWQKEIDELRRKRALAKEQGGSDAVERQHRRGRLTVRERIDALLDQGSFRELGAGAGVAERNADGELKSFTPGNYVLGFGRIEQRPCVVGGEDFTVKGGSPNPAGLRKSVYAEDLACQYRLPLVRLHEGGGGSVSGAKPGAPVGEPVGSKPRFQSVAQALTMVPVASAALGPVAGLPAARLAASHFSVMTRGTSQVMAGGPALVERALGRPVTKEELGGPEIHLRSGVVDNVADDEPSALQQIRRFLSYLPLNVWELPPRADTRDDRNRRADELISIVPRDRRRPYDMRKVIRHIVDDGTFFEMAGAYGRGQITGLARLNGSTVGIFANDCNYLAGAMTADGARKARRFIDFCDTFHIPIVAFVDEPGFMIGPDAERAGTIREGTSTVLAAATCSVPWASVIVRKSYGVAGAAHYGPGAFILAWPSAEMGALPVEGGVAVAFGREIAAAEDPDAKREELERMMSARVSPNARAESFSLHELIDPRETRPALCDWLDWVGPQMPALLGPRSFGFRP